MMKPMKPGAKKMRLRAVISTVLLIAGLISLLTGLALYIGHTGMVLGLPRRYITDIHFWASLAMALAGTVHFLLNMAWYKRELKAFQQREDGDD